MLISCATGAPDADTKVTVLKPDGADVSLPLTELAKLPVPEVFGLRAHEAEPVRLIPRMHGQAAAQQPDPVVQTALGTGPIPSPTATFEGQGAGLAGSTLLPPPDPDGDVGPNHYVQIVNSSVTVFSKTGTKLLGPIATNTLFNGFNGACAATNDGDGTVRYDRMADRWVIAQFSVTSGTSLFFQCVAVSTTPDPTGSYTRYQFSFNAFNDYPKMGLWPDAYYFTYNLFPNNVFGGARVCAVDRVKMIAGNLNATQQCFDTGPNFASLLASDLDGPTLPPAGEPNLLLALDTTALDFFKFHVDFTTPANSTFSGANPTQIPVAAFTPLCNGGTCVVQPGTTQQLDSLADRLMNRLVYRNFGDHEALLVTHAVAAGAGGGVRFYELRLSTTTPCTAANCPAPTIFQQGTFAPDPSFRWMSSAAFDQVGDIAMGYSISSGTINPGIRYTGRLTTDPLGTMGPGEATLIDGTASQTGGSAWGTYSSMNIDPSDDCTFWYTQEYLAATGSSNLHTRIGNFKFANCGVVQCLDNTFTATGVPKAIPDNNATGITSTIPIVGNGNVASFTLSLNITHPFRGDLLVTLTSPAGTTVVVFNGSPNDSTDNLILVNASTTVFNGQVAAGNWKLKVVDRAAQDVGTLNSWSIHIVGNCTHWSGSATPNLPTIDNGTACTSLNVVTTGGDSAAAKLDISGNHTFCSILSGTLAHNGKTVPAFPTGTFPQGPCTFSFTNRSVPGLTGDSSGTWTFCITDNNALGDTGTLNSWSVHD